MRTRSAAALLLLSLCATAFAAVASDDPRRSQLWWFDRIGVEDSWGVSQGAGVTVAVLDTGVDGTHPDLVDRIGAPGIDLIDRDEDPADPNGHGTIVAGLIVATANNDEGGAGIAPLSTLLPVRVLGQDGRGASATVDQGIRWAVDNGADIINLSLEVEESTDGTGPDPELIAPGAAIEYAWDHGVIVVAATGNSGAGAAGYSLDSNVVLVGAVDRSDELASFSDADRLDAVMAPGVDMVSTWCRPDGAGGCDPDARYGIGSGTSFAAPIVAGVLAQLRAAGLDHVQSVAVLRETAEDLGAAGPDETFGVGVVDAAAALARAAELVASPQPPIPAATTPADDATADDPGTSSADVGTTPAPAPTTLPDGLSAQTGDDGSVTYTDEDGNVLTPQEAADALAAQLDGDPGATDGAPTGLLLLATVLVLAAALLTVNEAGRVARAKA